MSAARCVRSEDQFLCSICLDVFTDPVTTSCGHNFCKHCITQHWDTTDLCKCPLCKEIFDTRPQLKINTFIREMVAEFRHEAQQKTSSSSSEQQAAKPGEVPCDVCTGTKLKALKSCLVCLLSYCDSHLETHRTMSRLKRHQLIHPVDNLEDRMCRKHDKPLELFCKTDQTCVCMLCSVLDHKTHEVVPLKEEYEGKKAELGKTEDEIQQMIQKRQLKIEEMKESVKMSKDAADREKAEGVQVFTALKESVERGLDQLIKEIDDKQKTTEKQAKGFIKDLEQEVSELMKRSSEVKQLSRSEDHLHLLQSFSSLKAAPPTKDWTEISVRPPSYEGTVVRAVTQLEETLSKDMKKLLEAELKRIQQYAVDVTLDPDTAHPQLILSDYGKQVHCGDKSKNLPDNPERFSTCVNVLGKKSFSSGRFYFQVQVTGKTDWDLGVARKSIDRKGEISLSPQNGFWTVWLRNGNEYEALDDPSVCLPLGSRPEKVGVFVDYEEGLVSFHDVNTAALIYSFTGCSFSGKLYPFFCPELNYGGKNSAPLIICPVNQTSEDKSKCKDQMQRQFTTVKDKLCESDDRPGVQTNLCVSIIWVHLLFCQHLTQTLCVDMSAARCLRSEDQFLCSICLDVFTDPITTSCGHNFCKHCRSCVNLCVHTQHWDHNDTFQCPMCKKVFETRPELNINTLFSEMVAEFRHEAQQKASSSSSEQQAAKPGEVPCDVCTGTKLKALKSCLVCLLSYCDSHLEPHLTMSRLKRHQLIHPVDNLDDRMCRKHDKPLELFCKTDQTCVCMFCSVLDHKTHDVVPLKEEYEGKKAELGKTEDEIQQMILKRRLKIEEMKESVKMSKDAADREKAEGVQVFTALKESVERGLDQLIKEIEDKQKTREKQAEGFIKDLEQEVSELMKRSSEVKQLSCSEDHLHLLQSFSFLKAAPPTKDWTEVSVCPPSYEGTVVRAVTQLTETLRKDVKKLLSEAELKRVHQYAVDVTLDPDTAHPGLILSDDGKQVNHSDVRKKLPDNPERFSKCACVLGKNSFSSGRFYHQVQVKGKTDWDLGVARELIDRKGDITLCPQNGFWTVRLRNGNEYEAFAGPPVRLSLGSRPEKVGVFVDYEEGLVSFQDVDTAALIYSFTGCSFNDKLYSFFCPCVNDGGKNSAPLIICPVNHTV
ncbi:uncharacterized protein LOC125003930 [Mugil cephalus]|uniref:uncharacterized protein LOC125003930 n=1 Tax=Mugil cephalus TaxID=48193 RepID=UPI001FB63295|nr:uncharacterized protein LOC125003930 [Mugil cephalus]